MLTRELVGWIIKSLKILIFILGLAAVLELWGIKIGPIIAGLGLFGVAVALGAQDLFKNLISGILVLVERRFQVGDWIYVEGVIEGTVESIGFRSTVVRRFDKSQATIPNFQFAENAVINNTQTTNRRINWMIGLEYRTSSEQLKNIKTDNTIKVEYLKLKTVDTKKFPVVKLLSCLPRQPSLFETVLISINDYLVYKFLDNKISFQKWGRIYYS